MPKKDFVRLPLHAVPVNYDLQIKTVLSERKFSGKVVIELDVKESKNFIKLNSVDLELSNVVLSSGGHEHVAKKVDYNIEDEYVTISFTKKFATGKAYLSIDFSGELKDNMKGYYYSTYKTAEGKELDLATTQFEPVDARRAFPCWDEPAVKATFDITLVAPAGKTVLCNTEVVSTSKTSDGMQSYKFAKTPIMSTYLIAYVVGDFESVSKRIDNGVDVSVWAPLGKSQFGNFALDVACRTLPFYEEFFGIKYPLKKLDLIAIPDFKAGAMENWGLITYRETALLVDPENTSASAKQYVALVVGHELAHQWFGNLVTMEWWTHLWLNEGFATWIEYLCVDYCYPEYEIWTEFASADFARGLDLDGLRNSHPIEVPVGHPSEIDEIFDAISYSKGASVIRMIHSYIGDEAFRKGLNTYLSAMAYKNAFTEDLWHHLSVASGKPVGDIMSKWTSFMGYPVLKLSMSSNGDKHMIQVEQSRFVSDGSSCTECVWEVPMALVSNLQESSKPFKFLLNKNKDRFVFCQGEEPAWVSANAGNIGFYRVLYSEPLFKKLITAMNGLKAEERLGIYNDSFTLSKAGFSKTTQFLELFSALSKEFNPVVWSDLSSSLGSVIDFIQYLPNCDDALQKFKNILQKVVRPIFDKVGYDEQSCQLQGDNAHKNQLLRPILLSLLAFSEDQDVIKNLFDRFNLFVNGAPLDSNLRSVAYRCALSHGGINELNSLIDLYERETSSEEKVRVLSSFGAAKSEEVLQKSLDFSLSSSVKNQDVVRVFQGIANRRESRAIVWRFVKANWDILYEKLGRAGFLVGRLLNASTSGFYSVTELEDVKKLLSTSNTKGMDRTVSQVLEKIQLNISWLERDAEVVSQWLNNN